SKLMLLAGVMWLCGACAFPAAAQDSNDRPPSSAPQAEVRYHIEIENGFLRLAPLKSRVDVAATFGPDLAEVPATIENVAKYLRATDTNLDIVVSPDAAGVTIGDLIESGVMMRMPSASFTGCTSSGSIGFCSWCRAGMRR
ncbi:MAG TPA: hypothetical protein PKH32_14030, partial [Verrucomicrobiota bacterium]|nr:hypothetical protein [Verrucomicrobiota bacterium]